MRTHIRWTAALAFALGFAGTSHANTLIVPIEGVRAIDDGRGAHRVLLKVGPIDGLENMAISRAYLAINTDARGELDSPIALQLHPITHDWAPGSVSWSSGWSRAGGDFDEEIYARTVVEQSALGQEVRIDVEGMLREMRHGTAFYGFILTAAPYRGTGLRSAEVQRLPGLSSPRLVVEYDAMWPVRLPDWVR